MNDRPPPNLPWTGERIVPGCGPRLLNEHLHRYGLAATIAKGKRVLDIACGEGYGSAILAASASEVIGIDIAPEVIAHASRTYVKANLRFSEGSCLEIPLPADSIDLVVSFETIEHIEDHAGFLREIKRVLSPSGALIISSPDKAVYTARSGAINPFHKRELNHREFESLLRNYFSFCLISRQELVVGSWIAPDNNDDSIFGTFRGDIGSLAFKPGVSGGTYSLGLCSDFKLPQPAFGIYANAHLTDTTWDLLERFGSAEKIQNTISALEQELAHKSQLLARAEARFRHLESLLQQVRVALAKAESRFDELVFKFRRQLMATRKLAWFMDQTASAARRLRTSRRWKLANPFQAARAFLGQRPLQGYGHLDKLVTDFERWRSNHAEVDRVEEQLERFEQHQSIRPRSPAAPVLEPPVPTHPIEFALYDSVEVSIIIPIFNQVRFTRACLSSIQQHQSGRRLEVIIVDDCSTDESKELLPNIPNLLYIRNETNLGFIRSCNRGATQARGEYLLFLNNDTLVQQNWLSALLETFELYPTAGVVGAKLVYPDGRLQEAGGIVWRDGSGWNRGKFDDPSKPEYNYLREVDYCSAACLMIRKSVFEEIGGFDVAYAPGYYEDTDLAFKVGANGLKVLYQPLSEVIHFEGATGGTDVSSGAKKFQEINQATFAKKWAHVLASKPTNGDTSALEQLEPGRKHVLVIDHHLPMADRDSGSLRMFQILRIVKQLGHRPTFLPDNLVDIPPYGDELRKRGIEVVARPSVTSVTEHLRSHGSRYHIVILSRCATAKKYYKRVRSLAPQARLIFDTVDLHFLRASREALLRGDLAVQKEAEEMREQEYSSIREADETWVVSQSEREMLLRDLPGQKIEVVSNIVEVHEPETPFAARVDFLFIGSFLHPPNVDAVLYFVHEIFPAVREKLPDIKFYVIGGKAPPEIVGLAGENIIVTGAISDVKPFFDSVRLSVAPIRFGAGVKGKINQSLALGVPVVATSLAVEGMSLTDSKEVMIADSPTGFAQRVVQLYNSEELWNCLSKNGLQKSRLLFSPETARDHLAALLGTRISDVSTPVPSTTNFASFFV